MKKINKLKFQRSHLIWAVHHRRYEILNFFCKVWTQKFSVSHLRRSWRIKHSVKENMRRKTQKNYVQRSQYNKLVKCIRHIRLESRASSPASQPVHHRSSAEWAEIETRTTQNNYFFIVSISWVRLNSIVEYCELSWKLYFVVIIWKLKFGHSKFKVWRDKLKLLNLKVVK